MKSFMRGRDEAFRNWRFASPEVFVTNLFMHIPIPAKYECLTIVVKSHGDHSLQEEHR